MALLSLLKIISAKQEDAVIPKAINPGVVSKMSAVNFSEMRISRDPAETLVAFSIGAGIGVTAFDPAMGIGGILNFILPDSTNANGVDPEKVPLMFADTGVPFFMNAFLEHGASAKSMKLVVAGGAHILDQTGRFNIGQKNLEALKTCLARYSLKIQHEDIGGTCSRTLSLEIGSGCSCIKVFGQGEVKI
jgi:chemotaxis protein CheD